ncbi:MAG: peptidoglycan/xylan/chitin deacetylase (PgdA/CDA1 family) [Rhodothermales bacterium]|jgi:peptidoglycan/xylan/chitin deacetylase (PgdA/CDA1 family)
MSWQFLSHRAVASALPRMCGRLPGILSSIHSDAVYLTLDDGPVRDTTGLLLDLLADRSAHATFFLLGERVLANPQVARRILRAGHGIGSHGTIHQDPWRQSAAEAVENLRTGTDQLEQTLGIHVTHVRPPFGHLRPATWHWTRETRRSMTLWSHMTADYHRHATPRLVAESVRRIPGGSILVGHDSAPDAIANITEIVATLIQEGRALEPLPDKG